MKIDSLPNKNWYPVQPEHTHGWWVVSKDPEGLDTIDESGDGRFNEDTAKLIAAAPELFEALQEILDCPTWLDQATVPKAGIDKAPPYQVVVNMSISLTKLQNAQLAIAKARSNNCDDQ